MGVITGNWHLILLYIPQGYILKGRWVGFIFISLPPSLVYIFSFCYSTHQGDAAEYKITPCQYFSWAPFSSYKHSPKSHICFFFVFLVKPKFFSLNGFGFALKMAGNELNWMAKKKTSTNCTLSSSRSTLECLTDELSEIKPLVSVSPSPHKAAFQIGFHSDACLLTENISGFRVRADLTAGSLLIPLLCVACLHFTLTDYREPPFMCQGMLWCDKWPGAKWRFVCLPTCQRRPQFIHNTGGGRARRCVKERVYYRGTVRESGRGQVDSCM